MCVYVLESLGRKTDPSYLCICLLHYVVLTLPSSIPHQGFNYSFVIITYTDLKKVSKEFKDDSRGLHRTTLQLAVPSHRTVTKVNCMQYGFLELTCVLYWIVPLLHHNYSRFNLVWITRFILFSIHVPLVYTVLTTFTHKPCVKQKYTSR